MTRQWRWVLVFGWVASFGACPLPEDGDDGGPVPFEPVPLEGGFTDCGAVTCQPGQTCREEALCYLGCEADAECGVGERCGERVLGGVCEAAADAVCGDGLCAVGEHDQACPEDCAGQPCSSAEKGYVPCGDAVCAPGLYCANAAEGLCYPGCLSAAKCGCGRRCNASPGQPGACSTPIAPELPTCGDAECLEPEAPQTCPEDCTWLDLCVRFCFAMAERDCFGAGDTGAMCLDRCAASDETEREAFSFCVALAGGPPACAASCLDELTPLTPPGPP